MVKHKFRDVIGCKFGVIFGILTQALGTILLTISLVIVHNCNIRFVQSDFSEKLEEVLELALLFELKPWGFSQLFILVATCFELINELISQKKCNKNTKISLQRCNSYIVANLDPGAKKNPHFAIFADFEVQSHPSDLNIAT